MTGKFVKLMSPRYVITSVVCVGVFLILAAGVIYVEVQPPSNFPVQTIVNIKKDTYLSQAADILAANDIVKSPLVFKVLVLLMKGHRQVQAGDYLFDQPQSAIRVAYRMVTGEQGLPIVKVTIPEGTNSRDAAAILAKNIPGFDGTRFLALAKPDEGYLFPDTYFFYGNVTPEQVVSDMRGTFDAKIAPIAGELAAFSCPQKDIIAMASIVEREATSTRDREIIAGILWKRIDEGMPLQVDPPFYYLLGKNSGQLTLDDLKTDSPYNLYLHTGLPPTPIDNPSLDAISATVNPVATTYYFYLSGKDGIMHYAATLDGHLTNKAKYL
jgi:UPF0755 protein